jgi:hypothetical protein
MNIEVKNRFLPPQTAFRKEQFKSSVCSFLISVTIDGVDHFFHVLISSSGMMVCLLIGTIQY